MTSFQSVVILSNVQAELILDQRHAVGTSAFAELLVWRAPEPVSASSHVFKYRLAFVVDGVCVLRYDNEAGKGDHRHVGTVEKPYAFTTPAQLLTDFWADVDNWRP
ncbi:MAG: toxin-antitoxin system TumE family protein [Gammaproteobacteria bacterium]